MTHLLVVAVSMYASFCVGHAGKEAKCLTGAESSCHGEDASAMLQSRLRHEQVVETEEAGESKEVALQNEDHYHALLLAVPIALQNLTNYSGLISVGNSMHPMVPHKFGEIGSDKALLFENTHALISLMQEISDDSREACPLNSVESINSCLGKALCLIQSQVDTVGSKEDLHKYALYEEMYSRFNDISWPTITSRLLQEGAQTFDYGYLTPAQHSCRGTEMSSEFLQDTSVESADASATKAAAYRTSAALIDAAKTTHAVLDSHTHNSSVDATLAALRAAWEPSCKMLKCDATNFLDYYRASHSHSLALVEMGASAHHMQVHIRTRQRLERRMQSFLGDHGEHFQPKLLRDEDSDSRFRAAMKQYVARCRSSFIQSVSEHFKTQGADALEYTMKLVDSPKMTARFEARGKPHYLKVLRSREDLEQIESDEDSMALVEEEDKDGEQQEDKVRRGGKGIGKVIKKIGRGGKGVLNTIGKGVSKAAQDLGKDFVDMGNGISEQYSDMEDAMADFAHGVGNGLEQLGDDIAWVADAFGDILDEFAEWVLSLFECLGELSETLAVGYGKKFETAPNVGVALSFGGIHSVAIITGLLTGDVETASLGVTLSVVVGAVPGDAKTGGLRSGVGVAGGIKCSNEGPCEVGIAVGATGSALIPNPNTVACPAGPIVVTPLGEFGCFYSYTVVLKVICCDINIVTGEESCR